LIPLITFVIVLPWRAEKGNDLRFNDPLSLLHPPLFLIVFLERLSRLICLFACEVYRQSHKLLLRAALIVSPFPSSFLPMSSPSRASWDGFFFFRRFSRPRQVREWTILRRSGPFGFCSPRLAIGDFRVRSRPRSSPPTPRLGKDPNRTGTFKL